METITSAAVIIAVVDAVKRITPIKIQGLVTIVVAIVVGVLYALIVKDTSLVDGAINGLIAVGITSTAKKIG